MFVIIKSGGKQYKVESGDIVKLDYLGQDKGKKISFKDIIACNVNNKDYIGMPYLKNIEVKAEILENKKDKKILVFKKRRRHNSRRLNGHRQSLSVVRISDILLDGKVVSSAKKQEVAEKKKVETKENNSEKKQNIVKKESKPKKKSTKSKVKPTKE
jgi:large subunit ribosomal protein L21